MTDAHEELVARLFPDLEIETFEPLGGGWTVATYQINGASIVQLPLSAYAAERLRAQIGLLPELAREVSALIPLPERTSLDPPAMLYPKLEGAPADAAPDGIWPERLGRFLYDLHMVPPEFVGLRMVPSGSVRDRLRDVLGRLRDAIAPLLDPTEIVRVDALLRSFLDEDRSWSFACCLTHGDLGPEHVLVDTSGDLVGVLDWEEAAVADPAVDFAWWLHAMPEQGERALAAYGGAPDAAFRERASALFAMMPWYEVEHGLASGDPAPSREVSTARGRGYRETP